MTGAKRGRPPATDRIREICCELGIYTYIEVRQKLVGDSGHGYQRQSTKIPSDQQIIQTLKLAAWHIIQTPPDRHYNHPIVYKYTGGTSNAG